MLRDVGFADIRWGRQVDVFSGSRHESDAKDFDTYGVTFAGVKAARSRGRPEAVDRGAAGAVAGGGACGL